jgi:beta-galactosidase
MPGLFLPTEILQFNNHQITMRNEKNCRAVIAACMTFAGGLQTPAILAALCLAAQGAWAAEMNSPRERILLDNAWRFTKGDPADAAGKLGYPAIKDWVTATGNEFSKTPPATPRPEGNPGGGDTSYAQPGFNDSQWRLLNLPHDWGIEGPFSQSLPGETARLPWAGVGWYRKHLDVPASDDGRKIFLDVDGAMAYATVWLNGHYVGGWPYGYASWRVDLTPFIKYGGENVIAIRLDNPPDSSRWYPGGGIYRNVWLVKTAQVHVGHWGTYVTTPEIKPDSATVKFQVSLDNEGASDAAVTVKNEIFELKPDGGKGKSVAALTLADLKIPAHQSSTNDGRIIFKNPKLWSLEKPQRYVLATTLTQNGKTVDNYDTPFGVRTIEFTADKGFLLNGRRVPLNGVCDHADLGALGTAVNISALARQITLLKEMGCNAIRTSHNPPAPELLDLCDTMGMVVMDESFDCWKRQKKANDYHLLWDDWHAKDWRAELHRDRNHPSIVLWSIGNEIPEQGSPAGITIGAELSAIAHEEDPTRFTTAACNNAQSGYNGFGSNLDVMGFNYKPNEYVTFRSRNATQPVYGSETASCVSSRGEYFFPVSTNKAGGKANTQMSSYDLYAPPWATPPDWEFRGQDKAAPYAAGEFVWTGFDYLGEPTPYGNRNDAARSSYFGIIDLAGFPKDRFYLYQAHWRPDYPMAHILPHWTWPDRTNQVTPVHVYTSGDEAELFLNGKSLGRKKKEEFEYRIHWDDVVYQPGELKVVAYKNGKKWATDSVKTSGNAKAMTLQPDRAKIQANAPDLSCITVTVKDDHGVTVPGATNHIRFKIDGPGEIVATDNGDATSFESFQAPERNAFHGLALVIVRAKSGQTGTIKLTAESDGLSPASVRIRSN